MPDFHFWLRLTVLRCQAPVFGANWILRAKERSKSDGALDGAPSLGRVMAWRAEEDERGSPLRRRRR